MADNTDLIYNFDADTSKARAELQKLQDQIARFTADLNNLKFALEKNLRDAVKSADILGGRSARIRGNFSRGSTAGVQNTESAYRALLAEMRAESDQLNARFANDMFRLAMDRFKSQQRFLDAKFKEASFQADQLLKRTTPDVLTARGILGQRRNQENIQRAQYGDAAVSNIRVLDRLGSNGGADFLAIQARILANYSLIANSFAAVKGAGTFIKEFDSELRSLQAISGATEGDIRKLETAIVDLSNKTKFGSVELAKAGTTLAQAGLSAKDAGTALEGVSQLAAAAGTDLAGSVDILTSTLSVYNLQANETARVSNILASALNESKLSLDSLRLGVSYAGSIASSSGVSLEELVSTLGGLSQSGIRGSTAGTGLRQLLVDLTAPNEKLEAILKRLGLSIADIDIKTNGLLGVFKNLREAGFTSADALEAFELRAASAYSAIANTTDTIVDIREQLSLTSAATRGADVQSKSLDASFKRLTNTFQNAAYQALKPTVQVLEVLVDRTADFIVKLQEIPGLLQTIGVLLTGAAFAAAAAKVLALVRGFATLRTTLLATTSALAATTVAANATTVATTGVGAALGKIQAHPVLLAASAIAAVIAVATTWSAVQKDVNDQLDETTTNLGEIDGRIDSYRQSVDQVSKAIEDLNNHRDALEKDRISGGGEFRTRVIELKNSFAELGFEVNNLNPTLDDLVNALDRVRDRMASKLPDEFRARLAELGVQADLARKKLDESLGAGLIGSNVLSAITVGRGGQDPSRLRKFGPEAVRAFSLLTGGTPLPEDPAQVGVLMGQLRERQLATKDEFGKNVLGELISSLDSLRSQIKTLQENSVQQRTTRQNLLNSQLNARPDIGSLLSQAEGIDSNLLRDRANILRQGLDPIRGAEAFKRLNDTYAAKLKEVEDQLARIEQELIAGGATSDAASAAINQSEVTKQIRKIRGRLGLDLSQSNSAAVIDRRAFNKSGTASVNRQLAAELAKLDSASSALEVDVIEKEVMRLYDLRRKLLLEAFDLDDKKGTVEAEAQKAADLAELSQAEQQSRSAIQERLAEIGQAANELLIGNLERQAEAIEEAIRQEQDKTGANTSIEELKASVGRIKDFTDQLVAILQLIGSLKLTNNTSKITGRLPSAAAGDIQKMIIAGANQRGLDPLAALAIASKESGFQAGVPNGSGSSAQGIFQITDETYKRLNRGRSFDAAGEIRDGLDLLGSNQSVLASQLGRTPNATELYLAHLLGIGGYRRARGDLGGNAASVLGSDAVLKNGGNLSQTVADFLRMHEQEFAKHIAKSGQYLTDGVNAAAEGIKQETETEVNKAGDALREAQKKLTDAGIKQETKRLNALADETSQEIETLVASTRGNQSSKTVKVIGERIREKFTELLKEELAAFDKAGTGTSDERESLINEIEARRDQVLDTLLKRYWETLEKEANAPVDAARLKLDRANRVGSSDITISVLEREFNRAEAAAARSKLAAFTRERDIIRTKLEEAKEGTREATYLTDLLAEANERVAAAQREVAATSADVVDAQASVSDAVRAATEEWHKSHGVLYDTEGNFKKLETQAQRIKNAYQEMTEGVEGAFKNLFDNISSGNMSVADSFKQFGVEVIEVFRQIFLKAAAYNVAKLLFGGEEGGEGLAGGFFKDMFAFMFNSGPGMASGGPVTGGIPGKDSVPRMLMPGEYVLRKSAVDMIGRNQLNQLNALGNRKMSVPTVQEAGLGQPQGAGDVVNVWVVSERPTGLGPRDVVAVVADDISRKGSLRQLVKSVQLGLA